MKAFLAALKAARKTEILVAVAAICVLLVLYTGSGTNAGGTTVEEKRLQRILSRIEGAGSVTVMLSTNGEESSYTGAVVVSEGAGDILASVRIQRAVQALTGLSSEQIEIVAAD